MKRLFTTYLFMNLLLETLAAITLIGGAMGLFTVGGFEAGMWAMNYGFAALAMASAILWVWPHRSTHAAVETVLGILLTFHALISVSFAIQGNQEVPVVIHAVMAALAFYLYSQRTKWCSK
jgi:hypothetical protein